MIYLLILLPVVMAAVTFVSPGDRGRPLLLPLGALVHLALVVCGGLLAAEPASRVSGLGGWLLLDPLGKLVLGVPERPLFPLLAVRAGLSCPAPRPAQPGLLRQSLLDARDHDAGRAVASSGADVGGDGSDHPGDRPAHLLQSQRPLAGGDLEVPADRVGRDRAGPSGFVLPRLRIAQGRAGIDVALRPAGQGRPAPVASLAPRGLRAALHRLRHQDGPGADAHLEAGRLRRSAGDGGHAPGRGRHELCVPGDPAGLCRSAAPAPMPRSPARSWSSWACCRWPSPRSSWSASAISSGCWPTRASSTWASWSWASASAAWPFTGPCCTSINNGLTKGVLFLSAGNIHRAYGSKLTDDVQGALKRVPFSGALFLAGFFAITGSPPFGPFVSEFTIVAAAAGSGQYHHDRTFPALARRRVCRHGGHGPGRRPGETGRRARN